MSYLIDTNVLSELRRKTPDAGVVEWFSRRPASTLYLSVLTLSELRKGIEGVADSVRRMALTDWLETDLPVFLPAASWQLTRKWQNAGAGWQLPLAVHCQPLTVF